MELWLIAGAFCFDAFRRYFSLCVFQIYFVMYQTVISLIIMISSPCWKYTTTEIVIYFFEEKVLQLSYRCFCIFLCGRSLISVFITAAILIVWIFMFE